MYLTAFATVPRERFVGVGPWRVKSPWSLAEYGTTEDADPRNVYHNVLIALDESLGLNNGQPSLWAFLFDKLEWPLMITLCISAAAQAITPLSWPSLSVLKEAFRQSKLKQSLQNERAQRLGRGHKLLS